MADPFGQLPLVLLDVNRILGNAGLHGSFGHRRGFPDEDAVVEWLGDQILPPKPEMVHPVGLRHRIGNVAFGKVC